MRRAILLLATAALPVAALPAIALAEPPKVVTDIAPVHALVTQVMKGVGEPSLLMPQGASPHAFAMRPSEARMLSNADVIFWVGAELSPAVDRAIDSLGEKAEAIALLHGDGVNRLEFREGAVFSHGDAHADHDDHGHEKHADHDGHDHEKHADHDGHDHEKHADHDGHDHDKHAKHDDHDHEKHAEHDHQEHSHDGVDPHAWLSPDNLAAWAKLVAEELAEHDPANAATYKANAAAEAERLEALHQDLSAKLKPVADKPFLVFHDAYQYFETSFGVTAGAALLTGDAARPSAERLSEIREELIDLTAKDTVCIYAEPQYDTSLVNSLAEGTDVRTATLDPLGTELPQDSDLHRAIIAALGDSILDCLTREKS